MFQLDPELASSRDFADFVRDCVMPPLIDHSEVEQILNTPVIMPVIKSAIFRRFLRLKL